LFHVNIGGVRLFKEFLRSEFSDENLEFWLECEKYKVHKPDDKTRLTAHAAQIYNDFVADKAPRAVSVVVNIVYPICPKWFVSVSIHIASLISYCRLSILNGSF